MIVAPSTSRGLAALFVALVSGTAWAQGYSVTPATGLLVVRPASATRLEVDGANPAKSSVAVTLPFAFRYYGEPSTKLLVSALGWARPGVATAPADAGTDGVVAPRWATGAADAVFTWTTGEAPSRRFVVSWERPGGATQVHLHEGPGRVVFTYSLTAVTGNAAPPTDAFCGLDEPGGPRTTPGGDGDVVLEPRTVLFNSREAVKQGTPVAWQDIRRESVTGPGSAEGACYVAKGRGYFFTPDRALQFTDEKLGHRARPARKLELAAEDKAAFGGAGDAERWVRQVLDGKAILVSKDGGDAVRVWFRIIEYFTIDEWGVAGEDDHIWNLRRMLVQAFDRSDPRSDIGQYVAWRGMATARLSVVKLFDFDEKDDTARQFDTSRKNEYVLWCARFKAGARGHLAADETPRAGWTRFYLKDEDRDAPQHAEKGDLRDVRDPNYVDGGYDYVIANGNPPGWEALGTAPRAALTDEAFDHDPAAAGGPTTPK